MWNFAIIPENGDNFLILIFSGQFGVKTDGQPSVLSLTVLYIFCRHSGLDPESSPLIFLDSRLRGNDRTCKLISETAH